MAQLCFVSVLSLVGFWLLLRPILCHSEVVKPAFEADNSRCINMTKRELKDPSESLFTLRIGDKNSICSTVGVGCWRNGKVLSVNLTGLNLEGAFPEGLKYCGSMTSLDLSGNALSGSIPKDLCKWLPFLFSIDLSHNHFTGSIPRELCNCTHLNVLRLNDNRLSGSIPLELVLLEQLKELSLENNMFSGQIPAKREPNITHPFAKNAGLCGESMSKSCGESKSRNKSANMAIVIGVFATGVVGVCLFGLVLWSWLVRLRTKKLANKRIKDPNYFTELKITESTESPT